jgi:hypothetical protein
MKGQVDRERFSPVPGGAAQPGPVVPEELRLLAMLEPVPEPRTAVKAKVESDPGRVILEAPRERPMVAGVRCSEPW